MPVQTTSVAIKQALIALELSPADEAIVDYLGFLTGKISIDKMVFVHVLPGFNPHFPFPEEFVPDEVLAREREEKTAGMRALKYRVDELFGQLDESKVDYRIEDGSPLEELLRTAAEVEADLIVIGQEAGSSRHDILARNLARQAKCNVLVVPGATHATMQNILVPVDFSDNSLRALQTGLDLRRQIGGEVQITALNVYRPPSLSSFKLDKTPGQLQRIVQENHREGIQNWLQENVPQDYEQIESDALMRDLPGTAGHIYDYAQTNQTDLVIIGAKGHSRLELLLLGSVTEKLLDLNERCPTLVVK